MKNTLTRLKKHVQHAWNCLSDSLWDLKPVRWLAYRFHPDHQYHIVRTGDPPGYSDVVERMLQVNVRLLNDFVEREMDRVDWDWTEGHQQARDTIMEAYTFFNEIYSPFKKYGTSMIPERKSKSLLPKEDDLEYWDALDKWGDEDDLLEEQADYYLSELMKVRRSLWT